MVALLSSMRTTAEPIDKESTSTPSTAVRAFATRATQLPQCIPVTESETGLEFVSDWIPIWGMLDTWGGYVKGWRGSLTAKHIDGETH